MTKKDISTLGSINDVFHYVIDPLDTHPELTEEEYGETKDYLWLYLEELRLNTEHLKKNIITILNGSDKSLEQVPIGNTFEYLNALMKKRPDKLIDKLKKSYRKYVRRKERFIESKLSLLDISAAKACRYTHQWYQTVIKKDCQYRKRYATLYVRLGDEERKNFELLAQKNKNIDSKPLYGIILRRKSNKHLAEKLLQRNINQKDIYEKALRRGSAEFMADKCEADDIYGVRVILPRYHMGGKDQVDVLKKRLSRTGIWKIVNEKDYRKSKKKEINHVKFDIRHIDRLDENIEVQVTTILDNILDEFYTVDNHNRHKANRETALSEYRVRDDYQKMEQRLLSIMPNE